MVCIVYMVAGLSSRFGGKIKQFAKIGKNDETLIEVSMQQAKNAGFEKIIFVVGEKTDAPFKKMFGDQWQGLPIKYAKQLFDTKKRDKPWGTTDALVASKDFVNESFVVCNGDDLYGENALRTAREFLENNPTKGCCVGYELGKVLPNKGATNRGIFETTKEGNILNIREEFNIQKDHLIERNLSEETLASMNLFGLQKYTLIELGEKLSQFKANHLEDRKAECLLPVELGRLIKEGKLELKLLKTNDSWFGVTNPKDEAILKQKLSEL